MRLRQYILIGLLVLSCVGSARAQKPSDYGFSRITNVPSQRVYSLVIARDGFVWIASELGVFRYDGLSFTSFYNEEQSALAVVNLAEDSFGRIWCQNSNGQIFYIEQEQMRLLKEYKSSGLLANFAIAGNELLAFSKEGLFTYNLATRRSKVFTTAAGGTPLNALRGGGVRPYRSAGYFLLKVKDSIYICRYQNNRVSLLKPALQDKYVSITAVNKRSLILRGKYEDDLSYFEINGEGMLTRKERQPLQGLSRYIVSSVMNGKIWIHREKESFTFNDDTGKIKGLSLTQLAKDREGNIWASSLTYGLLLRKRKAPWQFFPVNHTTGYVTGFVQWRGKVITCTSEGYLIVSDQDSFLTAPPELSLNLQQMTASGALPVGNSLFVYGAPDLLQLDEHFTAVGRLPLMGAMHYAAHIENKMLVFSYYSGVSAVATDLATPQEPAGHLPKIIRNYFKYDQTNRQYINTVNTNKRSRCSYYDSVHQTLYVAFSNGLYSFDTQSVKSLTFNDKPIHAYDITEHGGKLYIATLKRGILVFNDGHIENQIHIPRQSGQDALLKIKLFGTRLWILSANNIYVYDLRLRHFIHTIPLPPLRGIQIFDLLEYKGYVYFSTTEGIYKVPLAEEETEVFPINYLLSVVVNSRDTLQNNANLSYNQNRLQFNLAALYYFNPKGVYFKYRLLGSDGGDTTWKQGQPGLRDITFPNLMPDDYTFEAVAYTANGLSADKTLSFSFTINKVWWQQWWFLLSMAVVTATIAYVIISLRINSRRVEHLRVVENLRYESERLKLKNMVNESELKALKSQMNPHFISNSLNNIQELIMRGDKIAANEQLSNFATLARLILLISGKRAIPLATEIHLLKNYLMLEGMRLRDNFKYDIIMEEDTDEWAIHIPPMIIQPFVENSVKHGLLHQEGDKRLTISFKVNPEVQYLKCVIADNGIGREKAAEMKSTIDHDHDSFSIKAIRKRLNLMGKETGQQFTVIYTDLKDITGAAAGTSVSIRIPILTP